MRSEDIASSEIYEGGTQLSWVKTYVPVPDGTERRERWTVLVRRERPQVRTRKKFNNQELRGRISYWVECVAVEVRST